METKIFIREVKEDPKTGHITIRLQSETSKGSSKWDGHVADYGTSAEVFHGRFGGDVDQLLTHLVSEHKAKIGRHQELSQALAGLVGKQIG